MKRTILLLTATLLFALVLNACSEAQETMTPGFETTVEARDDLGDMIPGVTTVPTDTMATEPAEITLEPTQVVTSEVTTEPVTDTMEDTEPVTSSEMIPVTGARPDAGRISNLLDFEVRTRDGEVVGEVENLVLNLDALRVQYVIIGVGGFLGLGEKEVAIPWGAFQVDVEDTANDQLGDDNDNWLVLNIDETALENAPDWDPAVMPELGDPAVDWDVDLRGYWHDFDLDVEINEDEIGVDDGEDDMDDTDEITTTEDVTGTVETDVDMNARLHGVVLASDPLGLTIVNDAGETVATLEDIIINTRSGKIIYVVVSLTESEEPALVPVPPAAFRLDASMPALVIADADVVLVDAPRFNMDDFPYTLDPDWDADVRSYWRGLDIDVEINDDEIGDDN